MQFVGPVERIPDVERNMDLIREMLLRIAADPKLNGCSRYAFTSADNLGNYSQEELNYHVDQLFNAGFVDGSPNSNPSPTVSKLTWKGHEFVDNIRDSGVLENVKERFQGLPSVSLKIVADIATAVVKKKLGL